MKTKTPMDDVHARVPVDRVAVRVTGGGVHFYPNKKIQTADSPVPIAIREINRSERANPEFVDLTGSRIGRFTVIGAAKYVLGRWVVRCDCGTYSLRSSRAIKNAANSQDRCEQCRHLAALKREEYYRRTGRDTDINNF